MFANRSNDASVLAETLKKHANVVIAVKVGLSKNDEQVLPLADFSGATWGSVDTAYDINSNILSHIRPFFHVQNRTIEALSFAVYRKYISDTSSIGVVRDGRYVISPLRSVPLDESGNALIRFFNPPSGYETMSMIDVLRAKTPEEIAKMQSFFRDKIVLVGEYGTLIHDDHFSPVDTRQKMPGVEFHANMIDGLLQAKTLSNQSTVSMVVTTILIAGICIIMFFLLPI